jgi:hypothetical protein
VFQLAVDHGLSPVNGQDLLYGIVPGVPLASADAAARDFLKAFDVVCNTDEAHAIKYRSATGQTLLLAVVWSIGEGGVAKISGGKGWTVTVDRPCTLLIRSTSDDGVVVISASSPAQTTGTLSVTIDNRPTCSGVTLVLPGTTAGYNAGATTSSTCGA